jgi:putative oxidoreductase
MSSRYEDLGKLIIRLMLGAVMLPHGIAKLTDNFASVSGMLEAQGLPGALAYGVVLGEIVGPVLLIVGFYGRIGAALIAINMLAAIALAHRTELLHLNQFGGWALEYQGLLLATAVGLLLIGPGRFGINTR